MFASAKIKTKCFGDFKFAPNEIDESLKMQNRQKGNFRKNKPNKGAGGGGSSFKKPTKGPFNENPRRGVREVQEIEQLKAKYDSIVPKDIKVFNDFPLSQKTVLALTACKYTKPTEIQRQSIGYALQGRDVLGAAITGSGKTLAFLVPVIENLFVRQWVRQDGVGAIIISPTRELAYQIFEALKKVGANHDFSAGLIIGGKNLKFERSRMDQCNVVICTPGRLLQHMDENPLFNCSTMQVLVLDEADRCLDMGFEKTMNAIIENLPPERQTLLFSATQTKSVKDLARLSLTNPVYVAPHEQSEHSTPDTLKQNYVVIDLEDKLTMLWSFIKNHLKQKCIVFLSSCKQVKYFSEILKKLRPGVSVLALYGTLHQEKRMEIYDEFCRKLSVVLLATDVASRGLDFPVVNWVIQLDCPEDATAYIHRAGRTARHTANGESLLVLLPSEEDAMIEELRERKIPINKIQIDPKKMFSPKAKMESFLAQNQELKMSAQRAFVAYIKSVVLMKNKKIFNVDALDTDAYAKSLGLEVSPRVRFLQRIRKGKAKKQQQTQSATTNENSDESDASSTGSAAASDNEESDSESELAATASTSQAKGDGIDFNAALSSSDDDDSDADDFMTIKRRDHEIPEETLPPLEEKKKKTEKVLTKAALAKKLIKKKIAPNTKVIFDEDGTEIDPLNKLKSDLAKEYEQSTESGIDIEKARASLREEDKFDKERFKQLMKTKRREKKKKLKNNDAAKEDDFGTDDSDAGPDLSWLPDPSKFSANRADLSDSDENEQHGRQVVNSSDESDSDDFSESEPTHSNRFRAGNGKRDIGPDDSDGEHNDEPVAKKVRKIASKLSVDEAELFAMQLLQN